MSLHRGCMRTFLAHPDVTSDVQVMSPPIRTLATSLSESIVAAPFTTFCKVNAINSRAFPADNTLRRASMTLQNVSPWVTTARSTALFGKVHGVA